MNHRDVALIKDGVVFNIAAFPIDWETILSAESFGADFIFDYTDLEEKPEIGYLFSEGVFTPPIEEVIP